MALGRPPLMITHHLPHQSTLEGAERSHLFARVNALSLLLCLACSAPRPEAGSSNLTHTSQRSGYVASEDGVRLFYRVEGDGPDTVVVLHGGPGLNLEGIRPDLRPLAERHAVLYFDQRGAGRSERPEQLRLTGAAMVEDLEAIRRVFRLERLSLWALSPRSRAPTSTTTSPTRQRGTTRPRTPGSSAYSECRKSPATPSGSAASSSG